MNQKKTLAVFVAIVVIGLVLRLFVFDIVVISNFDHFPKFQAGETILVSRINSAKPDTWVLIKNHPTPNNYSVRRLGERSADGQWTLEKSENSGANDAAATISENEILGRVVMTLWAFPCRTSSQLCSQTSFKILTFTN